MDRATQPPRIGTSDPQSLLLLPSRESAYRICLETLVDAAGAILLTGDAGMGKTWLRRKISAEQGYPFRWLDVEIVPSDTPDQLDRKVASALGLARTDRLAWQEFLAERSGEGERWVVSIDEAHNLTPELLEEVRVLSGFLTNSCSATLWLTGQTSLARRLGTPANRPFASRLGVAARIGPIDADEAQILLEAWHPDREWSTDEAERLHRDAGGEPRLLEQLARRTSRALRPSLGALPTIGLGRPDTPLSATLPPQPPPRETRVDSGAPPLLGPSRPPLRMEDGLIEVGWSPDSADLDDEEFEQTTLDDEPTSGSRSRTPASEALRAWREWAKAQGRDPSASPTSTTTATDRASSSALETDSGPTRAMPSGSPLEDFPDVWAESAQEFAPFGQLFPQRGTSEGDPRGD